MRERGSRSAKPCKLRECGGIGRCKKEGALVSKACLLATTDGQGAVVASRRRRRRDRPGRDAPSLRAVVRGLECVSDALDKCESSFAKQERMRHQQT